jgi:hypothetical protein
MAAVDPRADFEVIPKGACPKAPRFEGRAGITESGLRALEHRAREAAKACRLKQAALELRCEVCEVKLQQADKRAAQHEWAWRYGPLLGIGASTIAFVIGVVVGRAMK